MIRPLRRAHALSSLLLALVVVATLAAAIALRVPVPLRPSPALGSRP